MAFACGKCSYETDNRQAYEKHMARKTPCVAEDKTHSYKCTSCNEAFLTESFLAVHLTKCSEIHGIKCPTCHTSFKNRSAKSRHMKKNECTMDMRATQMVGDVGQGVGTIVGDHTTVHNNTINNVTINCTPEQKDEIVSFLDTDLDAVVALVLKDPSRFQLALQSGNLHQELCKATHYGDIDKNRNVLGIQEKGTSMRVIHEGQKVSMSKKLGITQIMRNNHKIANDDKTAGYFTKAAVGSNITTEDKVRQALSRVVQNKGIYVPTRNFIADAPKGKVTEKLHESMLKDFEDALLNYHQFSEYDLITPFGIKSFTHILVCENGRWWRSVNEEGGWAVAEKPRDTVRDCVAEFLETFQNGVQTVRDTPGIDRETMYQCKDLQEALDYLRPIEFAHLVFRQAEAL